MPKKIICFDFDGVVYPNLRYHGTDVLKGDPVEGALSSLKELSKTYEIVLHSARCSDPKGFEAVRSYLDAHGFEFKLMRDKPRAWIYVDDRAVCFRGDWLELVAQIDTFQQWQVGRKLTAKILRKRRRRKHA